MITDAGTVTFTTSAAAVMCLQTDQMRSMAMTSAAPASAGHASDTASPVMADSLHSRPERACCFEQEDRPQAIAQPYRSYPDPASDALVQLTNKLKKDFLGSGDTPGQVIATYAAAHGQTPRS